MGTPVSRHRGEPLRDPLTGHTGIVRWGSWGSVDGQPVLATGGEDGTVRLWDPTTGTALGDPMTGHTQPLTGPADGLWWGDWGGVDGRAVLAWASHDGTVGLWHPATGRRLGDPLTGHGASIRWGSWGSADGRPVLATGGHDFTVRLWDPTTGTALGDPMTGHTALSWWGAWGSVRGQPVLATGGLDGTVRLWDPTTRSALGDPMTGHAGRTVRWGAWHSLHSRTVLATGGSDGTVRLWDPTTGTALGDPMTGHTGTVTWGAWQDSLGDQPVLATGGHDGTVRLWDPTTGTALGDPMTGHTDSLYWGTWGSLGGRPVLATGGDNGTVRLWDPDAGTNLGDLMTGHSGAVWWGTWGSVRGQPVLATGGEDGTVRLWEVVREQPHLPSYKSDATADADELDRIGDARGVAQLITSRTATPPLAVGLFGDWGEGKSHFLRLLHLQVEETAQPDNQFAHGAVRQVDFNAWHYAETDLWASLVAELFAQLNSPPSGDRGAEQRRQSRLAAELVARRGVRERLQAARERHRKLLRALRTPAGLSWDTLPADEQQRLQQLAGDDPEEVYRQAALQVAADRESGETSWRLIRGVPLSTVAWFLAFLVALCVVAFGVWFVLPRLWLWVVTVPAGALAAGWALWQIVDRSVKAAQAFASQGWDVAKQTAQRQRLRLETKVDVSASEVRALENELQNLTAAGQLAGLVAERAANSDYRSRLGVMTQIREDFQHMAALLADAAIDRPVEGGISQKGGHVEPGELDLSLDGGGPTGSGRAARADEADDELPRIDRIILYIDDLDRCPPRRAVEMLEAIHLLLALELFVVVVAVDPRWLLRAIETHYHDLMHHDADLSEVGTQTGVVDPDAEELWRSTPAQYLEKIFQVVLTLPPLYPGGYRKLLRNVVGARPDQLGTPDNNTTLPSDALATARPETSGVQPGQAVGESLLHTRSGVELPAARVVDDPLTLESEELALLDLLGPPLLVATPRGVKRLANSYGLLTALRREHRQADLVEHHATVLDQATGQQREVTYVPYRAGMVLLAALIAYPALGPALFLHLHHTAASQPDRSWKEFLAALKPHSRHGRWHNIADSNMTPVEAQQWQALLQGLNLVITDAAEAQLDVPEPLTAWAQWVVPVGRLSFPTGRIVSSLERQRPLGT
ncbi:P-loop NTPase fold protein [Streptomyces massasporeus]|uniref:P-loop NTPase fold protein n=1 Tax=Streptomyces massasporeus TaxID=67324 RepID=UPI0033C0E98F